MKLINIIVFDNGSEGLYNLTDEYYDKTNLLESNLSYTDEAIYFILN